MDILSDLLKSKELLDDATPDFVVLQRHGEYRNLPKGEKAMPKSSWNPLTEKGEREVVEAAAREIRRILDFAKANNKRVNFAIFNSGIALSQDNMTGEKFGVRAKQSADLVVSQIDQISREDEYKNMEINIVDLGKSNGRTREYARLEANPEEDKDVAEDVKYGIKVIDRMARRKMLKDQNTINVYWMETHHPSLLSMIEYGFDLGDKTGDYGPETGEILEMQLANGMLTTEFKGQTRQTYL